jgi:hypothetical protein
MFKNLYSTKPLSTVMYVMEGEDPPAGAGAGGGDDLDAKIAAAVAAATQGLKAKNDELLGKLKTSGEKLKSFEGIDPAEMKALKERLDQDEDALLLAQGKKNVVIEKYTERMRAQHAADLVAAEDRVKAEAQRADTYRGAVLDNQIRSVCTGLHKGAVEDALLAARQLFVLDAKGNAVQLDSDGVTPVRGKDGTTPFSPAEWIEQQKELKPHWFPSGTSGSGSLDVREGGSGTGKVIKRADFDKLSPVEQGKVARSGVKLID